VLDHPTKLTAHERIRHSRDMVCAHQNLNGLLGLTMHLSVMVCHPWASTCCHQPIPNSKSLFPPRYSLRRYARR